MIILRNLEKGPLSGWDVVNLYALFACFYYCIVYYYRDVGATVLTASLHLDLATFYVHFLYSLLGLDLLAY